MKGLRDILVHEYGGINDRLVYQVLSEDLGDFKRIRAEVAATLARAG